VLPVPVPTWDEFTLPLLRLAENGQILEVASLRPALARHFKLTDADLAELLPSGRQTRFANRVGWAKTSLTKAGLLESPSRGTVKITDAGRDLLAQGPTAITAQLLQRYPSYREWELTSRRQSPVMDRTAPQAELTPEEAIEQNYEQLREALRQELIAKVRSLSAGFFERLVVDLLLALGYGGVGGGRTLGRSGDGGVDGVIKEDKLGLDVIYVQAKRWTTGPVDRGSVQAFAGSLEGHKARKGVFITTSGFAESARDFVERIEKRIVLIDGPTLADLMIEAGLGITEVANFKVWKIDSDYLNEELPSES
jgi:restriction system protein